MGSFERIQWLPDWFCYFLSTYGLSELVLFFQIFMAWKDKLFESGVGWGEGGNWGYGHSWFWSGRGKLVCKMICSGKKWCWKICFIMGFWQGLFSWNIMNKKVFCNWPYNSLYFYIVSVIWQVAWVARVVTHYIYNAIWLQLCQNNSFSTTMQLHYNYNHNVMLMLLIFIHPLKFDTWHYENFWI